jgi:hypothetical protein
MTDKCKLATLEYLANLAAVKNQEYNNSLRWLNRSICFFKYWMKGEKLISIKLDFENASKDIEELEVYIEKIIEITERDWVLVCECLNHFEKQQNRYSIVGREYCIDVLKCAEIRLRELQ